MLNEQTFEFSQARLKIKDALRFTMRQSGGGVEYLVEDEVTGRFFRVGLAQYTFLTMLDGRRTVSTALMKSATLLRENAFDDTEAASLCKWAIESGLIESETGNSAARRQEQHEMQKKQRMVSYLNPMMMRFPLFNPDPIVSGISRFVNFLISPLGAVLWTVVVAWGFTLLARNWQEFYTDRVSSFGAVDIIWLGVTWVILKIIHELAHSLVCKRYGGRVHSCGILFLLMIPMPYVDVTTSWRFDNKWKRILTSAAGMLAELFIAGIACYIWAHSNPGPLQYHASNVIISATVVTLLFNINPLMKFDGYFMLADFLEIPNLAGHGRQWLKGVFKWMYFGKKPSPLKEIGFRGIAVRIYGVLAMAWFFSIAIGLSLAASSLVEGFGLVVAIIGLIMWAGIPLFSLCKFTLMGTDTERPNRFWFAGALALTALLMFGFLKVCPSPSVVTAPIVIDYEPLSVVRANAAGFAASIHVSDGESVEKGDLLVTLINPELEHELSSLEIDIQISKIRSNALFNEDRISEVQLEQESYESLVKRKSELEARISDLEIFAPQDGRVIARDLDSLTGQYFEPGNELLSIGKPGEIHAIALTKQTDIDWVESNQERGIDLVIWGRHQNDVIEGKIKLVNPRAREDLPHDAFSASAGGPLAVVPRSQVKGSSGAEDGESEMILTNPRVPIEISLSEEFREQLIPGQTGQMFVRSRDQNMGDYLANHFMRFIRENNVRTHGL